MLAILLLLGVNTTTPRPYLTLHPLPRLLTSCHLTTKLSLRLCLACDAAILTMVAV